MVARKAKAVAYLAARATERFLLSHGNVLQITEDGYACMGPSIYARGRVCDLLAAGYKIDLGVHYAPVGAADLPEVAALGDASLVEKN